MIDVPAAEDFVSRFGTEVEQAQLHYLKTGSSPLAEITGQLFADQRSDGGFAPFWAPDYSSLDATCYRLAQAEMLGLTSSRLPVQGALEFLRNRQKADGSFQEDDARKDAAPPWAAPGDEAATLYLTANCGFWLAVCGGADTPARRAAAYLESHLAKTGHLPSFLHAHWLGGALWFRFGMTEPSERIFDYLQTRLEPMTAGNLAWMGVSLRLVGVPDGHLLLCEARRRLETMQRSDGSWPDDEGQEVHVTLEALQVLKGPSKD